ncbi:IS110 family transposase [Picosynechococcus sp. PCC 8807]|uniref:IS110 family transposase n=1 Tax=Picosynechococcus sp. PCC 8807 TaxID=195248 RepID=UPI0008106FBE|nr:transposase [Picosynechococcus sp. PCC 8807]ANV90664.1 hypothetical protein AWQ24_08505 [Picosynechococcus sp. PCC 8807]
MKILGIDIGRNTATCCLLDHLPDNPREYALDGVQYRQFTANAQGIKEILAYGADIAILEPTGTNYSKLWGTHLARNGVEVRLVAHHNLKQHREFLRFPDKDDEFDSFALAHYGWTHLNESEWFLQVRDPVIVKLREYVLRLAHLNRVQSPIICRLKQDLAWQFPEISEKDLCKRWGRSVPLWLQWLAGRKKSKAKDAMLAKTCGLGLNDNTRRHAARLCDLIAEEIQIEKEINLIKAGPRFAPYLAVFEVFGMGDRLQNILLTQIFPIEGFLNDDLKPIIIHKKGRYSKKQTKREISRRRFEKSLGLAPSRESSGQKDNRQIVGGSDLCRTAMWMWIFTRVSIEKQRNANAIAQLIYLWMNHPKRAGTPIRLLRTKTAAYASRLLFKALVGYVVNGEYVDLASYHATPTGHCSQCGDRLKDEICDRCEFLKVRLEQTWIAVNKDSE